MKRWRYKTLHFELKKDGILGSPFLDEAELERSLCRYGQDGWELVAVLDVQDGLIALCKQPFSEENIAKPEPVLAPRRQEEAAVLDVKDEPLAKPAAKPPKPEQPASLFGDPDDEDEARLKGPSIDTDGADEEGSGLSSIKIE